VTAAADRLKKIVLVGQSPGKDRTRSRLIRTFRAHTPNNVDCAKDKLKKKKIDARSRTPQWLLSVVSTGLCSGYCVFQDVHYLGHRTSFWTLLRTRLLPLHKRSKDKDLLGRGGWVLLHYSRYYYFRPSSLLSDSFLIAARSAADWRRSQPAFIQPSRSYWVYR
jgi:hypothetical protein